MKFATHTLALRQDTVVTFVILSFHRLPTSGGNSAVFSTGLVYDQIPAEAKTFPSAPAAF